jgi:hypothetical protein
MTKTTEASVALFIKAIEKFSDNIIFVSYPTGFAGNVISRIISASPEIYFEGDPVRYPNSVEGFLVRRWPEEEFSEYFKKQHLAACHAKNYFKFPRIHRHQLKTLCLNLAENRKIVITTHDTEIHNAFNCQTVRTIGYLKRINDLFKNQQTRLEPVIKDNVINIRIDKLLSENYNEFEEEYFTLCQSLNIFPQINSVRSFILLWIEKQKRYVELINEKN